MCILMRRRLTRPCAAKSRCWSISGRRGAAQCRMIAPAVEEVAADFEGRAVVGKVDVDEQTELARRFGIMSIPTLVVMKGGKVVEQAVGARGKADIAAMLERHL